MIEFILIVLAFVLIIIGIFLFMENRRTQQLYMTLINELTKDSSDMTEEGYKKLVQTYLDQTKMYEILNKKL
jgi:hypothetical protein